MAAYTNQCFSLKKKTIQELGEAPNEINQFSVVYNLTTTKEVLKTGCQV